MKKRLRGLFLMAGLIAILSAPLTAFADGHKVVALGADLSQEQINMVLRYFGILGKSIDTIYVTNTDERNHLGGYIPIEQIGTRTISCALVNPTTAGGIQVKTANMNYVTSKMIASTLSTAGVVNCEVLAAAPFEVSGTGALTGVMMAYEYAMGARLDPVKKDIATQELITTEQIASQVGQNTATQIINDIKVQIVENQVKEPDQVVSIVEEAVGSSQADMSGVDIEMLQDLAQRIAEQDYDYEEMKETLKRIDEGVNGISSSVEDIAARLEEDKNAQADNTNSNTNTNTNDNTNNNNNNNTNNNTNNNNNTTVVEMAVSIFNSTDDKAFGEDTLIDATSEEAMDGYTEVLEDAGVNVQEIVETEAAAQPAPEAAPEPAPAGSEPSIFDNSEGFSWDDSYSDEGSAQTQDIQIQEPEPAPAAPEAPQQEITPEAPVQEENPEGSIFGQQDEFDWSGDGQVDQTVEQTPEEINIEVPEEQAPEQNIEEPAPVENPEPVEEPAPEENPEPVEEPAPEENPEPVEEPAPEENPEPVEEPAPAPVLEITDKVLVNASSDEVDNAAGGSVLKFEVNAGNVVPVSGRAVVYDDAMNEVASVDLTDTSKVFVTATSPEDLLNNMWENGEDGTTFFINLGYAFERNKVYTVAIEGTAAMADNPEAAADISMNTQITAGDFGVALNVSNITDLRAGSTVTGKLVYNPESITYAEIVSFDGSQAAFDKTTFDLTSADDSFAMTLYSPGTTEVVIDFYSSEEYAGSYTCIVNVLE